VFSKLIDLFHDKYGVEEAEEVWRWLVEIGEVEPNLNHFNVKMRLYSQALEADKMIGLKNTMEENGIRLDVVSYTMLVHVLGKRGQLEEAERLVSEMQGKGIKPNVVTFNSFLSSLSEHKDTARFRHWKSVMRKLRTPENALTSYVLVDSHVRLGQLVQAENLISDMIRRKKKVKSEALTSVMNSYASRGDIDGVERCRLLYQAAGLPLGEYAFNVLLKAFLRAGDAEGMIRTSEMMRSAKIEPNAVTFTTLMKACSGKGDFRRVRRCFDQMLRFGIKPDRITYNTLLNSLRAAGDVRNVEKYVKMMDKDGINPDVVTYNTLLSLYSECGRIADVKRISTKMKDANVARTEFTYNTLISAYANAGDVNSAEEEFYNLKASEIQPTVVTLTALIHAHAKNENFFVAERILRQMKGDYGVQPNHVTYSCLIHAMLKYDVKDRAMELYEEAKSQGFKINIETI